tara:strand:+ start:84195 stop:84395 length:201 start_codon:yes stop_codon:yes gene_type:complete
MDKGEIDIKLTTKIVTVEIRELRCIYTREIVAGLKMQEDFAERMEQDLMVENRKEIINSLLDNGEE